MGKIMTGMAAADMEMPVGMDLTGYLARASSSKGVHDELKIRCIVLDDGSTKFALVVCDLLGLSSSFTKKTAETVEKNAPIPADNIVIACTHTHSGPASIFLQDCGEVSTEWLESLKTRIVDCVMQALIKLKPSSISYKTGKCDINLNRVVKGKDEIMRLRDNQVGVLEIRYAGSEKTDAMVVNYACHPVILAGTNLFYTKDYPYYMEEAIKKRISPDINIIFTSGCCGDLNPIKRGGFDIAKNLGEQLTDSVVRIETTNFSEEEISSASMTLDTFYVNIPLNHKLDEKNLVELRNEYHNSLNRESENNNDNAMIKLYKAYINWTERMLDKLRGNTMQYSINAEIKLIRIGKLVIVTLPFEAFHDIGIKIKKHFGYENTIVLGYANGNFGYLPSKSRYSQSAYEVQSAYKFYGYPGPVCEDAEDIILDAILNKKVLMEGIKP